MTSAISSELSIERMSVTILSAPVVDAVPMSFGQLDARQACILEIDVDGVSGLGESWINYPAWAPRERTATLLEGVAPLLIGTRFSSPRHVQQMLLETLLPIGRQWGATGPIWQAISAVDLALWDLLGKAQGISTAQALSDVPVPRAPNLPRVYASGVGPTDVELLCERALKLGIEAVKVKLGFGQETDRETLSTARETIGPDRLLFADANQAWDMETAISMSNIAAEFDVAWLEEPLSGDSLNELEKLAADISIPLATGENIYGITDFERYIASAAVSVIQPDLAKSGGLTVGKHLAKVTNLHDTALAPHCYGSALGLIADVHLAAATSAVHWIEYDIRSNPLRTDLFTEPLQLCGSVPQLPNGAGHGVELSKELVERYCIYREERTINDF